MADGICPYCSGVVERLALETIRADGPKRKNVRALALRCPSCNTILGVTLHPMALAAMSKPQDQSAD
jgi:uncharacterized protein with PIN domain